MHEASPRLRAGVGGLFLAGLLGILVVLGYDLWVDRHPGEAYYLRTTFQELGDLTVGAPVKSGGVQIGQVLQLNLTPENRVEGLIRIVPQYTIPDDSEAKVSTATIAGDSFLEIPFGQSPTPFPQISDPRQAPSIPMMHYVDLNALMNMGNELGTLFSQTTENLRGLIEMPGLHRELEELNKTIGILGEESANLNEAFEEILIESQGLEWSGVAVGNEFRRARAQIAAATHDIGGKDGERFKYLKENTASLRAFLEEEAPRINRIQSNISSSRTGIVAWIERFQAPATLLELLVSKDSPCSLSNTMSYGKEVFVTLLDESLITKIGWLRVSGSIQNEFEPRLKTDDTSLQVAEKWMVYAINQIRRYGHLRDPYDAYRER